MSHPIHASELAELLRRMRECRLAFGLREVSETDIVRFKRGRGPISTEFMARPRLRAAYVSSAGSFLRSHGFTIASV
jgi:hypothetical protein